MVKNKKNSGKDKQTKPLVLVKHVKHQTPQPKASGSGVNHAAAFELRAVGKRGRMATTGREYLSSLATAGSSPAQGGLLFSLLVGADPIGTATNPSLWNVPPDNLTPAAVGPVTRLAVLMSLFSKFKFKRAHLVYEPRCPFTTAGALLMGYYPDPADVLTTSAPENWHRASVLPGNVEFQVFNRGVCRADILALGDRYVSTQRVSGGNYSAASARLAYDGAFVVLCSSGLPVDTVFGDIYFEYELEVEGPELPVTDAVVETIDTLYLTNTTGPGAVTSIPIDPLAGPIDVVNVSEFGLPVPSWWDAAEGKITEAGTYFVDFSLLNKTTAGQSYTNAEPQVNSTSTFSASLSGWAVADATIQPFRALCNDTVGTLNLTALAGLYKFVVATTPYIIPGFLNFFNNATPTILTAYKILATIFPERASVALADKREAMMLKYAPIISEYLPVIRDWCVMSRDVDASLKSFGAVFYSTAAAFEQGEEYLGVSWPHLDAVLRNDLYSGRCTAQLLFQPGTTEIPALRPPQPSCMVATSSTSSIPGIMSESTMQRLTQYLSGAKAGPP